MSGRVLGVLCATVLSASVAAAQVVVKPTNSAARSPMTRAALVFNHVNVVDVETGQIHTAQRVVVANTRIRAVGPMDKVGVPRGAREVDARGKYLIPGLWDMHAHNLNIRITTDNYASYLIAGVTGVRDMLSSFPRDSFRQWWDEVLAGKRVSPRIVLAGYLNIGTYAKPAPRRAAVDVNSGIVEVGTPEEGRQAVDSFYHAGVEFIKVHSVETEKRDVYFAIAAEARRLGIPLAGHLPTQTVSMAEASDSGQRSFEHIGMWTSMPCWQTDAAADSACAALASRLRRNDSWLTPTMVLGMFSPPDSVTAFFADRTRPRGWYAHYRPDATSAATGSTAAAVMPSMWFLSRLHRFGFPLLAGTDMTVPDVDNLGLNLSKIQAAATPADLTVVPGLPAPLHGELFLLVEAGLSPLEALQTATLNPAKYFRATDSLGTVAPGKLADLVLLDADPLADIANVATIRAVVANGRYFDRAALDALAAEAKRRIFALVRTLRDRSRQEGDSGQP